MATHHYRFLTRWRVRGTPEEVFDILTQPLEYTRWWPSVYLRMSEISPGNFRLWTRGWFPYTLKWHARTTESHRPKTLALQSTGDLTGHGIWSIVGDGDFSDITFDWEADALKPVIRHLSFLLKPAFEANHRWAMEQGLRSLQLELRRYRAGSVEEANQIPDPPFAHHFSREAIAGTAIAVGLIAALRQSGA